MGMVRRRGRGVALADLLDKLVQASPDFEGAVLVGLDGLVMAAAWPTVGDQRSHKGDTRQGEGQSDLDVGAAATRAFELSGRATQTLDRGDLDRLILLGSKGNMIITRAGPHALCAVLLKPQAKIGVASFEAQRISSRIAQVLE